ncbi:transposase [Alloacidobacterium dinghuense]|uniref:Transposase n=1 Tax=Alloacidobacterium dinghuense TaxID=2763107 RepID=A0A7G8BPU8_9BACT|nr:transposase [Alloacidobacterium dinghuense]QNI34568.1 transposase [Alloacidobacterium dinghuense]
MRLKREPATRNRQTYFVTSETSERRPFFRYERWSKLFLETLYSYRAAGNFQLHEFVLPDHFHLIITPEGSLEKAVQLIKGGFSRHASLQFETKHNIWQRGFADHRIRDIEDFQKHKHYIWLNPVKAKLCTIGQEYAYSSAFPGYQLDAIPQGLKPRAIDEAHGTAEAVPLQRLRPVSDQNSETFGAGTTPDQNY